MRFAVRVVIPPSWTLQFFIETNKDYLFELDTLIEKKVEEEIEDKGFLLKLSHIEMIERVEE